MDWVRSSYCSDFSCVEVAFQRSSFRASNTCVEVGLGGGMVYLRDSKHPELPPLEFTGEEFDAFVKGVKNGEF